MSLPARQADGFIDRIRVSGLQTAGRTGWQTCVPFVQPERVQPGNCRALCQTPIQTNGLAENGLTICLSQCEKWLVEKAKRDLLLTPHYSRLTTSTPRLGGKWRPKSVVGNIGKLGVSFGRNGRDLIDCLRTEIVPEHILSSRAKVRFCF